MADVRSLSPRVRAVELHVQVPYSWRAGQHVAVFSGAALEDARYYSLASMPTARGTIELCVGDSEDAPAFPLGGQIWLSRPEGRPAVLEPVASLVLIGIGTGVAPLRAVLFEQEERSPAPDLILLCGFRSERDVLYASELEVRQERGQLDYRPVLSRPGTDWVGRTGHVQAHLGALPRAERYCVCGKREMVRDVQDILLSTGVAPDQVFAEGY